MVDYFQNSISDPAAATPGLVVREALADIESGLAVEDAAGIGLGVVVSRGTTPDAQVTLGDDASSDVLGITCRVANAEGALGSEATNAVTYAQYETIPVIRRGYVWVYCTGTGNAGSRNINYNDTTGAIDLGTATTGETQLYGAELCNTITSSGSMALLRIYDLTADPPYLTGITMNGQAAETITNGIVDLTVVEEITMNGQAAETNTNGTVDLTVVEEITLNSGSAETNTNGTVDITVVESIDVNTSGSPISGAIDIQDGANINVGLTAQVIDIAYNAA